MTVTISGQTLSPTVESGGTWTTTTSPLTNGTYDIVAQVSDSQGNTASATQSLTIDTMLPIVVITGGAVAATNDPTPPIA